MKAVTLFSVLALVFAVVPACSVDEDPGDQDGGMGDGGQDGTNTGDGSDNGSDNGHGSEEGPLTDQPICNQVELTGHQVAPNVLLVVDKSGSMKDATGGANPGRTKIMDLKDAVSALLTQGSGKIRFGWMAYPLNDSCGAGTVSVAISDTSVATIRTKVTNLTASGGTPTGDSLNAADRYYTNLNDTTHPGYVVLITDGLPTCPQGGGSGATPADAALALEAVQTLHGHGIDTFVIGLGEGVNASNPQLLSQMADAGGQPRAGAVHYYQANSLAELQAALSAIGGMVMGCHLALNSPPENPNDLWVYFDGQAVARDRNHLNGWDYDAVRNSIDFYGAACQKLQNGSVQSMKVEMGCSPA